VSSVSSLFNRPLMIYDDKCYSCAKFAHAASWLSRGWIRTAGHYYSQEARDAKKMIFPAGYDPTRMFWLVNSSGAFGARSGLPHAVKEIFRGWLKGAHELQQYPAACEYSSEGMSCFVPTNIMKRFVGLLSHGATFRFHG